MTRNFEFNTIQDVISALNEDYITANNAVLITCKALTMINLYDAPFTKKEVLKHLKTLQQMEGEKPLFFGLSQEFNIKEIYKPTDF